MRHKYELIEVSVTIKWANGEEWHTTHTGLLPRPKDMVYQGLTLHWADLRSRKPGELPGLALNLQRKSK